MYSLYCLNPTFHHDPSHISQNYRYMGNHHASSQGYDLADVQFCLQLHLGQAKDPGAKKRCVLQISRS